MNQKIHYKFVSSTLFLLVVVALSVFYVAPKVFAVPGVDWTLETSSPFTTPRQGQATVVFDKKLWSIGGRNSTGVLGEVWWTLNGIDWTKVLESPGWQARSDPEVVVFKNEMWLIGGWNPTSGINFGDIWTSGDGQTWSQVSGSPYPWGKRRAHQLVVYGGELYLIGGLDDFGDRKNDVWKTSDGINWQLVTDVAPWVDTAFDKALVYKNEIWLLGSWPVSKNVWHSSDGGQSWGSYTANWPKARGGGGSSVVFDNKLWIMGGQEFSTASYANDALYSSDGQNWFDPNNGNGTSWAGRIDHSTAVFLNKIWVIGGRAYGPSWFNDAWSSQ